MSQTERRWYVDMVGTYGLVYIEFGFIEHPRKNILIGDGDMVFGKEWHLGLALC